jgi:hypothetical protein
MDNRPPEQRLPRKRLIDMERIVISRKSDEGIKVVLADRVGKRSAVAYVRAFRASSNLIGRWPEYCFDG